MDKNVHLEKITFDNAYKICNLKVKKEQRDFVASNLWSLAHAYIGNTNNLPAFPFGIYLGKKPVGFLMIGYITPESFEEGEPEIFKNSYFIWRLMIDKRYQGNGYGRQAIELALDFIKTFPCGKADYCGISYEIENKEAKNLYASFGFKELKEYYKGEEGEEMPAVLKL